MLGSRHFTRLQGLLWALVVVAICSASRSAPNDEFRFRRAIKTAAGWSRLELPGDVLAHSRPDLSDLRVLSAAAEIPYALEESLVEPSARIRFTNVESKASVETTALLDRGERRSAYNSITLEIAGDEPFLKPVLLEVSEDGSTFRTIARGSIFRNAAVRMLTIRFAPNDRRYLRVRFDDRLSAPLQPVSAQFQRETPRGTNLELTLTPQVVTSADNTIDTYSIQLPSANLDVESLTFDVRDPAFSRKLRVYESVVFRGELSRRALGETTISQSPGGDSNKSLQIGTVLGREIEFEIERLTTALDLKQIRVAVRPRRILFHAPNTPSLELLYGSTTVSAPKYDLVAALASGRPERFNEAHLGEPPQERRVVEKPLSTLRGPRIETERWAHRQSLRLPAASRIAFVDLPSQLSQRLDSVRIIDQKGQQVPYVVEAQSRQVVRALSFRVTTQGSHTEVSVPGLLADDPLASILLSASAPEYFERSIQVFESVMDARGEMGRRTLGQGVWQRLKDTPPQDLSLSLYAPSKTELVIDIDNGDNPTLTLSNIRGVTSTRRIDFAFDPGDVLALYWDNRDAPAPRYDLTLIADAVLSSPALGATLGVIEETRPAKTKTPAWFWWAAVGAGFLVVLVLARTLRSGS